MCLGGGGGQGGCERRIEVFVKIPKNIFGGWSGGEGSGWGGGGGQGRCDLRIKVFGENSQKKIFLGGGSGWWGGVRVDVNEELKFL